MNPDKMRLIDRWIGVPACFAASIFDKLLPKRPTPSQPKRILVMLLSEMGSLVLAYPMFKQLQQQYPQAEIHALMFKKNKEALSLLNIVNDEHIITLNDVSLTAFLADSVQVMQQMWQLKFDIVIDCELFARVSSLFAWLSFAPIKIGFHRHKQEGLYRGSFLTHPIIYNPYLHISSQFLHLAKAAQEPTSPLGKVVIEPPTDFYRYTIDDTAYQSFSTRLQAEYPTIDTHKLILLYPSGGILPIRAWPEENYIELAESLIEQGYQVAIIGLPSDQVQADRVVQRVNSDSIMSLAGFTKSIKELLMLLHFAKLLITNDGGPAHFASLINMPCITLFGPETPVLYGPKTQNAVNLHTQTACSPCLTAYNHRNSPCDGDNQCLKLISVDQVLSQANIVLSNV